jgi:mono/diheme cytochrome c family protein
MKRNMRSLALSASLLALTAIGCQSSSPESSIPPPPRQPVAGQTTTVATTTSVTSTPGAAAATPAAPAAGAAVGAPTLAAAPDVGFEAAKAQPGYADVKKLGKNPLGDTAATAQKGQALFLQNCAPCHGQGGEGDGPAGMALDPKPRNFTNHSEYQFGYGDLGIFRTGKYGVTGTGMAPWQGRMTDEQIWQTVAYVRTLQK